MEEIGPVDYLVVAFPGNQFRGEIGPAIAELIEAGTIRVIDITFVGKNADGEAVAMELTELDPEVQAALESTGVEVGGLFNEDDLMDVAEGLEPNSSAALLVWENVWRGRSLRRCETREASSSRSSGCRTTSSRPPVSGPWAGRCLRRTEMMRKRGPGLVLRRPRRRSSPARRGRSHHRRTRSMAQQDQEAYDPQAAAQQAAYPPPAAVPDEPAEPDYAAELQQLAQLKNQGILTEEEFEAKKKR